MAGFEAPFAMAGEQQEWLVAKHTWDAAMGVFNDPSKKADIINELAADDLNAELVKRLRDPKVKFAGQSAVVAHAVKELAKVTMPGDECKSFEAAAALYEKDGKEDATAEWACNVKHPGVCRADPNFTQVDDFATWVHSFMRHINESVRKKACLAFLVGPGIWTVIALRGGTLQSGEERAIFFPIVCSGEDPLPGASDEKLAYYSWGADVKDFAGDLRSTLSPRFRRPFPAWYTAWGAGIELVKRAGDLSTAQGVI